jgi:D-3-phosphoglycerate dehydrogenase
MTWKVVMIQKTGGFTVEDFPQKELNASFSIFACQNDTEIITAAHDADAIICSSLQTVSGNVISKLEKCRLIHAIGVGYDRIDIPVATERGICVSFAGDYCTEEVAEHTMAMIVTSARKIVRLDRAVREGKWDSLARDGVRKIWPPMYQLKGQTLGLIGFGRIARMVVPKAKGFEMKVIAYDPFVKDDVYQTLGVGKATFDQVLKEADFISINAASTPANKHMFGEEQFKKMKPTAYLINNGRAEFIEEKALVAALAAGKIAGAGLDVVEGEKLTLDNPLIKFDNVIITGHSAYYSEESGVQMRVKAYEQVGLVLNGGWPSLFLNPDVKEKYQKRWGKSK